MIKIFGHYFNRRTLLQVSFDLFLVSGVMLYVLLVHDLEPSNSRNLAFVQAFTMAFGVLLINAGLGFYLRVHNRTVGQTYARAILALCASAVLAGFIKLLSPPSELLVVALVCVLVLMLITRIYLTYMTPREYMRQRVLIYGTGKPAKMVGGSLKASDPSVDVVGYYASPNEVKPEVSAWGVLEVTKSISQVADELKVDEIVVALTERRGGSMPLRELLDCKLRGIRVVDISTHFEKTLGQIRLDSVSAGWLIFGEGFVHGWVKSWVKRIFDIVCASILIVLTLPIMVITGILIVLESPGSMLYSQERVGLNGRVFNVVKFRSMRSDAEKDGKPRWATAGDSRVTRVGRIIRKLRIDELPQLFVVLGGSMSMVGPRPERPYFVDQLTQQIPFFAVRQSVKPGVTGWAQVRYQYGASVEDAAEKLQYDLFYVKNHSLFLDIVILFETVGVVLLGKGAQ
ncbi:TIGR03013 family XrtA/PEP-CTERM system glycosyltransferase [Rhodoferax sp. GW822-FHT02A01]|uniref:TIGR03013 family XrtA/PEP-CTERM system glycosyltransferase n=1 Tax=Rhodoferax sp. GW822-FHT02A01 TaxID=3141537 RepID=UPI00315CC8DE